MSKQLMMKFMLQLHTLPTCLERRMWEMMGASESQAEQTWTSHHVALLNEISSECRRRRTGKPEEFAQ